jgi:hypothetical protein
MPYFYKPEINLNLLFIHIPKTGGTSLEKYFSDKYNISLNRDSLYSHSVKEFVNFNNISFQHQTYSTLYNHKDFFKINFTSDIKIIAIVRYPYERIISDLFYFKLINIQSKPDEVLKNILMFLNKDNIEKYDNHPIPQYKYVTNENGELIKEIHILNNEYLNSDMYDLGYNDFNQFCMKNNKNVNYFNYLNNDSIRLINQYYEKDFLLFGYKMKKV